MTTILGRSTVIGMSVVMALCCVGFRSASAEDYDRLLRRIPDDANVLILLNVDSVFSSKIAKSEDWKTTYADNFAGSPLIVPPSARRFVLGAEIQIESMEPIWESASMELNVDPSMEEVAEKIGGVTDDLLGVEAVWPSEKTCIVKFAAGQFGALAPASRQSAARWALSAQRQQSVDLSSYLTQAARYAANTGPEIIMAIDLDQILRPEAIEAAVRRSDLLRSLDRIRVADVLTTLRGVTLGVRVTDRIYGKMLVDFGKDATILEPVAKQLILQGLSATGAMVDEFNDWESKVKGKRVSIEGPLSKEGMRRLFSLVTLDTAIIDRNTDPSTLPDFAAASAADETPDEPTEKPAEKTPEETQFDIMASASYRYFRSIDRYFNDLQRPRRSNELSDIALWINNFARKIERLPARNVDPELLDYGQKVVYGMRDAVGYLYGVDERTRDRQARVRPKSNITVGTLPTSRVIQYGPYYRYREYVPFARANIDIGSALEKQDQIAVEEYQAGTDAAQQVMEHLKSETENIRQIMTQRYGGQF